MSFRALRLSPPEARKVMGTKAVLAEIRAASVNIRVAADGRRARLSRLPNRLATQRTESFRKVATR